MWPLNLSDISLQSDAGHTDKSLVVNLALIPNLYKFYLAKTNDFGGSEVEEEERVQKNGVKERD
jgi:hypothetical protein